MSDVLLSRLEGLQYQRETSFLAFTSEYNMLASSVEPPIPARRACEMFNARLPAEYDMLKELVVCAMWLEGFVWLFPLVFPPPLARSIHRPRLTIVPSKRVASPHSYIPVT